MCRIANLFEKNTKKFNTEKNENFSWPEYLDCVNH